MKLRDLLWLALVAVAVLAARSWFQPLPEVTTVRRLVPVKVAQRGLPAPKLNLPAKITTATVKPTVVESSKPHTDETAVRFCAPQAPPRDTASPTAPAPPPMLLLRATDVAGRTLTAWGTRSDASAYRAEFRMVHTFPHLEVVADGDSVVVHEARQLRILGLAIDGLGGAIGPSFLVDAHGKTAFGLGITAGFKFGP